MLRDLMLVASEAHKRVERTADHEVRREVVVQIGPVWKPAYSPPS